MSKKDILIGIPTYKNWYRIDTLLSSLEDITPPEDYERLNIVVLDDGTSIQDIVEELREACQYHKVKFIQHERNKGIPSAWNSLSRAGNEDIIILFNDDIVFCNPDWVKCIEYFLKHNDMVGGVGFPLIQVAADGTRSNEATAGIMANNWGDKPGRCGASVGCSFGFTREAFNLVDFREEYISFHEESNWGFRLAEKGWLSYMLHYPPMEHHGSQTFAQNPELSFCEFKLGDKEEYKVLLRKSRLHQPDFVAHSIKLLDEENIAYRMDYSRYLFAKEWDVLDYYDCPQVAIHRRVVDPWEPRLIHWLDEGLNECEGFIR